MRNPEPDPRAKVLQSMSEREFQSMVRSYLGSLGWMVFVVPNMRMTEAGLPDLMCVHPNVPVLLAWELKTDHGRITQRQADTIKALKRVPGVDARILRPSFWVTTRSQLDEMMRLNTDLTGSDDRGAMINSGQQG